MKALRMGDLKMRVQHQRKGLGSSMHSRCFWDAMSDFCRQFVFLAWIGMVCISATGVKGFAQGSDGGYESVFSYGVGARALGLGGAYVAAPGDASAVYWNPGGLDLLVQKSIMLFHSTLPLDGQSDFIGYVHPTVNFGTIGVGLLRVGNEGAQERDTRDILRGDLAFSQMQILVSYGKQLPIGVSIGASLKVEQQDFRYSSATASGRGIGLDLGVIYRPQWLPGFLQNMSMGLILQNAIPPILKVKQTQQQIPRNYKVGLAKPINLSSQRKAFIFLADFEKGEGKSLKVHFGAEFSYLGTAMLRVGYMDKQMVFGAGAAMHQFRIDYSYGNYAPSPELPASHRISISIHFGKTKEELIELAKRRREAQIAAEVAQRTKFLRELEIKNNLDAGKTYFQNGDYFSAYIKFTAARDLDPENKEANSWVNRAQAQIKQEEQKREEELKHKIAENQKEQQRQAIIERQLQKGIRFFDAGMYNRALAEWEYGLQQEPENPALKMWVEKTHEQIQNRVKELRRQADGLAAKGKYLEAIDKLSELKRIGVDDKAIQKKVEQDIARLQRRINYSEAYRRGVTEYFKKNYLAAMQYFEQALRLDPQNEQVKEYYQKSEARANAREEPFKNSEIQNKYKHAVYLYFQKKYQDALKILNEIQKEQPHNKLILKLIDDVEDALRNR